TSCSPGLRSSHTDLNSCKPLSGDGPFNGSTANTGVNMNSSLILGGARSGKSRHAEKIAGQSGLTVTYIATAQVHDEEFGDRVAQHQARRPSSWKTVESPHYLAQTLM